MYNDTYIVNPTDTYTGDTQQEHDFDLETLNDLLQNSDTAIICGTIKPEDKMTLYVTKETFEYELDEVTSVELYVNGVERLGNYHFDLMLLGYVKDTF